MSRQVGSAHVEFSARTAKVVTGMEEAKRATRAASKQMKADINEAKASIALLGEEVGVKLPRHLRSFVAELPGVASAMSAAFNGAAIVGLGMIAVEQGKKIYEFFSALSEVAEKSHEEYEKLGKTITSTYDDLVLANDQLQNTINKFEGKKENTLKVQLDEAVKSANTLAKALGVVADQEAKILKEQEVGWTGRLVGKDMTGDIKDQAAAYQAAIQGMIDHAHEELDAARETGDKARADRARTDLETNLRAAHDAEVKWATRTLADKQKIQDQTYPGITKLGSLILGRVTDADAAATQLEDHITAVNQEMAITLEEFRATDLAAEKAGETGVSAAERQKKAQQELFDKLKALTENYYESSRIGQQQTEELTKTWLDDEHKRQEEIKHSAELEKQATAEFIKAQREMEEVASAAQKGIRQEAADDFALTEQDEQTKVAMAQETNSERITNLRAAMAEREQVIQQAFADEAALYDEGSKQQQEVQREALKDAAAYARETAAMNREALESGIGGAMTEMVRKAMDTATQMRDIFTSMVNGVNDQLVKLMTGQRVTSRDWSNMFGGVASQAARAGLTSAEGYALKALGVGKPDGSSSSKALWVRNAENIKKAGSDIASLAKGSPDPSTSPMGGFSGWLNAHTGGFFGSVLSALVPHAAGGPVVPGGAYLVGERGPEAFFPGVSGSVGTNAAMRRAFSSSPFTIHMPVDARGASDPAAVNAAVHRAMVHYVPTIVTASAAFQQDMKRRTPALSGGV